MAALETGHSPPRDLSPGERRAAVVSLLRSLLVSSAICAAYFVLPLPTRIAAAPLLRLAGGLVVVGALLSWQIREILRSPYPGARAVGALVVSVPLFLVLFATTYVLLAERDPTMFSEPLTRLDALYFTVTVFATVGFGDITAVTQTARAVAMTQMIGDLVLVGLIARAIVDAVNRGRDRLGAATRAASRSSRRQEPPEGS